MMWALQGPQLGKRKALQPAFVNIDGFPKDSELRELKYVYGAANREVTCKRYENTRDELLRPSKNSAAAAAQKAGAPKAIAKSI